MKRTSLGVALTVLALTFGALPAAAVMGGIGFHSGAAPLGVRHWFSDKVAGDLGFGYVSDKHEHGNTETKTTTSTIDVGLPICVAKYEKAHLLARPGFEYFSQKDEATGVPDVKTTGTTILGELEAEYWLTDKVSLSASEGVSFGSSEDDLAPKHKTTTVSTLGNNFTELGFHFYLW